MGRLLETQLLRQVVWTAGASLPWPSSYLPLRAYVKHQGIECPYQDYVF